MSPTVAVGRKIIIAVLSVAAVTLACGQAGVNVDDGSISSTSSEIPQELQNVAQYPSKELCPDDHVPGHVHCLARVRETSEGVVKPMATPQGFGPSDLQSAYKLPSTGGSGITVAIVDAQDDPNAEQDLATYRSTYGLPPCTTANGCFKKVNESGVQGSYPSADQGWAGEIALDIEMVSAACPSCKILLVEANQATDADLGKAENTAVSLGATVISNSYGGSEDSSVTQTEETYFHHPGVAIFVSAGDNGYGAEFPASSQYITSVGGTALAKSSNARGWVESVWGSSSNSNGGTGSGCSAYVSKPSWQTDTGCSNRMISDVSAVADPNTGVAVYDSYGSGGWTVLGGTSVASPLVAGIFAVTGHVSDALGYAYSHQTAFNDVTSGTNGNCSGESAYFCQAQTGYDGPTGWGTPNGAELAGSNPPPPSSGGDFSFAISPTSVTLAPGSSVDIAITTAPVSGDSPTITFPTVYSLPDGVTASFSPASVTAGDDATLTLTASSSAPAIIGDSITVRAESSTNTHTHTAHVTVSSGGTSGGGGGAVGDFSFAIGTNEVSLTPGSSTTIQITSTNGSGSADTIDLKVSSLVSGVTYSFSPSTITAGQSSTLTLTASSSAPNVTDDSFTIRAVGTYKTHTHSAHMTITGGSTTLSDFSFAISSTDLTVAQGGATTMQITSQAVSGPADTITLKVYSLPDGVTYSFSPSTITAGQSSTLTLTASASAPTVSSDSITVEAIGTSKTHTHGAHLTVTTAGSGGGSGGTSGNVLQNGVPVTVSGTAGGSVYYTYVSTGGTVQVAESGGTGDADLYVKVGSQVSTSSYDCRPYLTGNNESCSVPSTQGQTVYVMLNGYQDFSGVSLVASN